MRATEKYLTGAMVFVCALLVVPATLTARIITVDDDGPADFTTIQAAIDDAVSGDEVVVQQGVYAVNTEISFKGKAITVRCTDPTDLHVVDNTVVNLANRNAVLYFRSGEGRESVLAGLTILGGRGISCKASPTIRECGMYYGERGCIYVNTLNPAEPGPLIMNCRLSATKGILTIGKCTIYGCIMTYSDGLSCYGVGTLIANCTIINNTGTGIECTGDGVEIVNCIVRNNSPDNVILRPDTKISYCNVEGLLPLTNDNIDLDPGFVSGTDHHLAAGSVCIDAGDPDYFAPVPGAVDMDGEPRWMGSRVDIGADEFTDTPAGPIITLSSHTLYVSRLKYEANPVQPTFSLQSSMPASWYIVEDCPWLEVSHASGVGSQDPCEITVSIDTSELSRGTYSYPLQISSNDAANSPTIEVNLTVQQSVIDLSDDTLHFYFDPNAGNPPEHVLAIANSGEGTLNFSIVHDCNWLIVTTPTWDNVQDAYLVALRADGFPCDYCSCTLSVADPCAANSPQLVTLTLEPTDTNDILHVPSGYPTIQAAVDAAKTGSSVVVAPGTYTGDGNRDIDFKGKAIIVRSTDPNDPNIVAATIVDTECTFSSGIFHCGVVFQSGEGPDSILEGFTITNSVSGSDEAGEGIACKNGSSPTIRNCVIRDIVDFDLDSGSGLDIDSSSPLVVGCTFLNNKTGWMTFEGGGAVHNDGGSPVFRDCSFVGNFSRAGGGLLNKEGDVEMDDCEFLSNLADEGGAILNYSDSIVLRNCVFANNHSSDWSSAILNRDSLVAQNCVFSENTHTPVYSEVEAEFVHCTFADNSAAVDIWDGGGDTSVVNSILRLGVANVFVSYSNVKGSLPGNGNIDVDPLFADSDNHDYHLKSQAGRWDPNSQAWVQDNVTSPCIDAGDPLSPVGHEPFPNGGVVNMGAHGGTAEASKSWFGKPVCETIVAGDINGDCVVDHLDFAIMARQWLREE